MTQQHMPASVPVCEQSFAAAFELAPIGMALFSLESRVEYANAALCEMLGYRRGDLTGLALDALVHPDDLAPQRARMQQLLAGAQGQLECEVRCPRREGAVVWAQLTCTLMRGEDRRPVRFIAHVQDVTRDRSTRSALETVRERLRQQSRLLDQARDAIVVHDLDRTIRYWNLGAQRLFGYTREQALGRTFDRLMGPGATLTVPATAELLDKGEWTGELDCMGADGRMLVVERRCTVMRDAGGQPVSVLAVNTDISERRRGEKEIVLLNNLLEQRIRKRTAELEASNEDLRDFAYSLAHDLRTPLASIDGFSAQLETRLTHLDEKSRHYLTRMRAGVKLMSDLTDALLALAALSNTPLLHQSVDLSAIARGIAERLHEQQPEREVAVRIEDTPRTQGDVRLLTNVMENLLGNAWKFTSRLPRAVITFGAESSNGSCLYHVKDNGAGFDPAYAYKLFGLFQRLHTRAEFDGTGIGLAMVRKIVSRHGGRVWAESAPGAGANFYFTLNESASRPVARIAPAPAAVQSSSGVSQ
jgi:PAS domain S-box-containing protein